MKHAILLCLLLTCGSFIGYTQVYEKKQRILVQSVQNRGARLVGKYIRLSPSMNNLIIK